MIRKLLYGLGAIVVALLGYAGWAWSQGAALPGMPLPALPASLNTAIAGNDSAAVADFAMTRCRLLAGKPKRACYEDLLLQLVQQEKIRLSMRALEIMGTRSGGIRHYGHDYSHVVGINAWAPGKDLGAVYQQCTELFQSGCYHGVVQAYMAYEGTDSARVAAICQQTPGISTNNWLRFQCVHGLGHGLLQTYTMNLPRALDGCDKLGNWFDTESCYGGAFMEFIVGGRGQSHHPHATVVKDTAAMDHEGMDHANMDHAGMNQEEKSWPDFKVRKPGDLLYPCSELGDKYQRACYQMQAGLMVEQVGMNFDRVAAGCDTAPEAVRATCYQGIGTYVSGLTTRDPARASKLCSEGSTRYMAWCFVGVVKNFVDVTANTDDGIAYCKLVPRGEVATGCYHAVGEEAAVLYVMMERRREACAKAEEEYRPACEYGAGLSQVRPGLMPRR